jgi:hypothetical protein
MEVESPALLGAAVDGRRSEWREPGGCWPRVAISRTGDTRYGHGGQGDGRTSDGTGHSDHGRASHAQSASEAWGARQEKDGRDPEKLLHGVASVMKWLW